MQRTSANNWAVNGRKFFIPVICLTLSEHEALKELVVFCLFRLTSYVQINIILYRIKELFELVRPGISDSRPVSGSISRKYQSKSSNHFLKINTSAHFISANTTPAKTASYQIVYPYSQPPWQQYNLKTNQHLTPHTSQNNKYSQSLFEVSIPAPVFANSSKILNPHQFDSMVSRGARTSLTA